MRRAWRRGRGASRVVWTLAVLLVCLGPAVSVATDRGGVSLAWFPAAAALEAALPPDEADEDRIATLGAAFIAEVLGPRPRRPGEPGQGAAGLRDLVAVVESGGAGYDAVVFGARVPPPRPPSRMTLGEILAWVDATPGQNHAVGRYQIVPKTLRDLMARLSLPGNTLYSPAVQDRMADVLIADAGHAEFLAGLLERRDFMRNLAAIWAGLPGPDGRSLYHGIGGNAAGMGWRDFGSRLAAIYPE